MPVITLTTIVVATVWVCDLCGRGAQHNAGTASPLTAEHFIDTLRWLSLDENTVACDRCRLLPDVANQVFARTKVSFL